MVKIVLAAFGLYIYLICPKIRHRCDMSDFTKTPVAHRGIHDNKRIPENSLSAFRAAVDAGCTVELDVQFTRDRKLIVFHDDDLVRLCGVNKKPIELTAAQLKSLRLLGTDEHIPTLEEVLALVDGRVPLLIEMKNALPVIWDMPHALFEAMRGYRGRYAIESFNPLFLQLYKKLDRTVPRGVLSFRFGKLKKKSEKVISMTLENLLWNFLAKPDFIAYRLSDYKKLSFRLNRLLGATTLAWDAPVTPELAGKARKYFDAFICDISDACFPSSERKTSAGAN
ncbi:MAG: glycerophosphodiester phosphodiesterase [Clostridia bacterium]|nr:glycerophosphodiester phosphodiesterase [Clostridia bacterium]